MQKKVSVEDLSESQINVLRLAIETGFMVAEINIEKNLNKETNNLEYENKTNSINIVNKLIRSKWNKYY